MLVELRYLKKSHPKENWPALFKMLLQDALQLLKKQMQPIDYFSPNEKRNIIEERRNKLLKYQAKQRVSGLFCPKGGAERFAIICSVIDIAIKNS